MSETSLVLLCDLVLKIFEPGRFLEIDLLFLLILQRSGLIMGIVVRHGGSFVTTFNNFVFIVDFLRRGLITIFVNHIFVGSNSDSTHFLHWVVVLNRNISFFKTIFLRNICGL